MCGYLKGPRSFFILAAFALVCVRPAVMSSFKYSKFNKVQIYFKSEWEPNCF